MQNSLKGHASVFSANVIFGLGVPVCALLLDRWVTPMGFMLARCAFAAALFWLVSLFMKREPVAWRDLVVIAIGGLVGVVASQTFTAWALVYTTPVYYSIIGSLTPVATLLLATVTIGEKFTPLRLLGTLLGVAGALLIVLVGVNNGTGKNDLLGVFLAFLSLLTWVVYLLITRKVSARYSPITQLKWTFLAAAIAMVPLGWHELGSQTLFSSACEWSGVLEMAFIVVFATCIGYFAIPYALRFISATTASIYTNLQPLVASLTAFALAQDNLTWDKPAALALVLFGAWLIEKK